MKKHFVSIIVFLGLFVSDSFAATIYVTPNGTGNGTSWADAIGVLQLAINKALVGDQVWVAVGMYKPTIEVGGTGDRFKTFQMKNGVAIYGGFAGTETALEQRNPETYETILSGDIGTQGDKRDNCYHVFYHTADLNLDATAVLDGFTVTAGRSDFKALGAGMYNADSSPKIINCDFKDNWSFHFGGGMYNDSSSPTVIGCSFINNTAINDGEPYYQGSGGGMYNSSSSPIVTDCRFIDNYACDAGGGIMDTHSSNATITGCTFRGNSTGLVGPGMCIGNDSISAVIDCIFSNHSLPQRHGVIYIPPGCMLFIENTVFCQNGTTALGFLDDDSSAAFRWDGNYAVRTTCDSIEGDLDGDGDVDFDDFAKLASNWLVGK